MDTATRTSLIDMAMGAMKERVDYEMTRCVQNIADPNTKATAKREITLKITLEPDENRQHVEVSCSANSKLAPLNPSDSRTARRIRRHCSGAKDSETRRDHLGLNR